MRIACVSCLRHPPHYPPRGAVIQRSPAVPELPTLDEAGVPGYDKGGWTGMFAPARVPDPVVARMYDAVVKVMKDPEAVKRFADDGLVATATSPAEFTAFVVAEIAEWSKLVQEMKMPIVTLGK